MNSPQKRSKRRRSISTEDSSSYSCSAVCYCCSEEEGIIKPANFMPATSSDGSLTPVEEGKIMPTKFTMPSLSSDDSLTPKASSSVARLISPATSGSNVSSPVAPAAGAAVVTPDQMTAQTPSDGLTSLPCFPALRTRNTSCDFPATAALERFMLKQRRSPETTSLESDFSPSFEDDGEEEESQCHILWPKVDQEESPSSPCHGEDLPSFRSTVSIKGKSPSFSVQDSFNIGPSVPSSNSLAQISSPTSENTTSRINTSNFSFISTASSSSCTFKPAKHVPQRPIPTVNQITEALARI